jgi:HEAT repeat protein
MKTVALVLLVALSAIPTPADDAGARDRTRQTLLYGIDKQVLDAIDTIRKQQDSSFTPELAQILAEQRSSDVQKAVLDLFRDTKVKDGESSAKAILGAWQDRPSAVVVSAVQYLAAIGANGLPALLTPLVDSTDNALALSAIAALGTGGGAESAALLVNKLKSPDYPDARKTDIILALGALKDSSALDILLSIARSQDEDKVRRMYAADSLGKIGDTKALPVLQGMFLERDALIRLYAASAIARFSLDEAFPSLIQGLRDENVKVREQSARALARQLAPDKAATAVPILMYKAEYDPEPTVRVASIQAMGAVGGDAAMALLQKIYSGADHPLDSRDAALTILVAQALARSLDAIRTVINAEWASYDTRTLESTARVLSTTKNASLREFYVKFLDSSDPVVRSYGLRGIAANAMSDLKDRVKKMADQDPNPGTRSEASRSLAQL